MCIIMYTSDHGTTGLGLSGLVSMEETWAWGKREKETVDL